MIAKALLVPSLLLIAGLVLLALAILAPARDEPAAVRTPVERVRALEALVAGGGDAMDALLAALDEPEPEVAAVAAVHLRGLARDDLIRRSPRAAELAGLLPPP